LQFLLQVACPETFGYTLILFPWYDSVAYVSPAFMPSVVFVFVIL